MVCLHTPRYDRVSRALIEFRADRADRSARPPRAPFDGGCRRPSAGVRETRVRPGECPTLFKYCTSKLRLSEAATFVRIRAARAALEFPRIIEDLREGKLTLDSLCRLAPYLTKQNSDGLLDAANGATSRSILALVAEKETAPGPTRDVIRPVASIPKPAVPLETPPSDLFSLAPEESVPSAPSIVPSAVIPPASRVRIAFTADDSFLLDLERLRALIRHRVPDGALEDVFRAAMSALLDKVDPERKRARKKGIASTAVTPPGPKPRRRSIPQSVKDEVWTRDGGRCAYVASDGTRCGNRDFIEYDHVVPWALGGSSRDASNIRLLCRPHNQRRARERFGRGRRRIAMGGPRRKVRRPRRRDRISRKPPRP